jgi:hypothetical protein
VSGRTKQNVAEYRWEGTNDDGNSTVYEKWIVVEYDENADDDSLTVTFAASQRENTTFDELPESFDDWQDVDWTDDDSKDEKTFSWHRFREVMNAIEAGAEDEGGREFTENVFVGGRSGPAAVGNQAVITGKNPTIGGLKSRPNEMNDFLHVYYKTTYGDGRERLNVQWVLADRNGEFPENTGSSPNDRYRWQVQDHELQNLLVEDPDTSANTRAAKGFTREFREALFLNPRRHHVIEML